MIGIYLINLDTSNDRLEQAKQLFASLDVKFTRISAFDGRGLNPLDHPEYRDHHARAIMGRSLVGGEIGCFISHRTALETFVASDCSHALIFEDDVLLSEDLTDIVAQAISWLSTSPQKDWRVMNLGRLAKYLGTPLTDFSGKQGIYTMMAANYYPMCAFSLCWTRKAAVEFLQTAQEIRLPVDNAIQNWLCRVGGGITFSPPLAQTTAVESVIDLSPAHSKPIRGKNRRRLSYGPRKHLRLWKNRLWAIANKTGLTKILSGY